MKIQINQITVISFILVLFSLYFAYHTVVGQRGIMSLYQLSEELSELNHQVENIRAERLLLEHKVSLLKSESLDLDLVEQQAKDILGLVDPSEQVIIINKKDKL